MTSTLDRSLPSVQPVLLQPVSWSTFEGLLRDLGDRRSTRLCFSQGRLEILSPLFRHESEARFIDAVLVVISLELGIELLKGGSTTLRRPDLELGVEPDACYYITHEPQVRHKHRIDLAVDPPPDLVIEVDVTSGSIDKLPIYEALGVPELWRCDGQAIEIYALQGDRFESVTHSPRFPWLSAARLFELLQQRSELGQTATLRQFQSFIRSQIWDGD